MTSNTDSRNTKFDQNIPPKRRSAYYVETIMTMPLGSSGCHMPTNSKSARKSEEPTRKELGFRNGAPFRDYTNATAFPSNGPPAMGQQTETLKDRKDEEHIDMWIRELDMKEKRRSLPDSAGDNNTENWNHHHMLGLWDPGERTLECPPDVQDESPQATSSDPAIRKNTINESRLRSRFSDDMESTRKDLSKLPKPTYADISTPVFTNPFGGNILLFPLPRLTQEDYIPLPDIFFQPGGYKEPSLPPDHEAPVRRPPLTPTTKQSVAAVPAKDISPFDTSNMTPADQRLLRHVLSEESRRVSRKRPSNPRSSSVFRARQREIKIRKPGHRPPVPPRPKRSLVLSYFRRRESGSGIPKGGGVGHTSQDTNEETQEGGFRGFVRWAFPRGMIKWVLKG